MATLLKEINVGYATGNWYLRLYEDSISQSIDGNYTTVNLRITLRADRSTWVSFDNRDAWIHGTHFTPAYRHDNPEHNIGTTSIRINHNADGTGSYSVGFGISTSYALNGSSTGGRTLPTIPRASGFTSVSGGTLGQPITLEIGRASSSFTHTVRYQFGSIVREYTNQSTSCSFTPPLSDASQIPNAMSGICTMTLYTYNGGTLIGTKSMTLSIRIDPTQCAPSFTNISVTRVDNGVPASWGIYVQGKSKATISIEGATAKYGASIVSYQISVEGFNGGNGLTAGPFRSGTISIKASIVDSRNISTNQITQIVVYENTPPALSIKAERCNSAGTPSNNGAYIKVTPTYSCASVNGKNYISSKEFKINGTSYQNTTGASGSSFILGNNDIAVSKTYVVSGIVTDSLGQSSTTIEVNIPTSSVPFHVREEQNGVAFGKYSEKENVIDSAWDICIKGINIIDLIVPIGIIIPNQLSTFDPNKIYFGTTWVRHSQGRVLVGVDENDPDFSVPGKKIGHKNLQAHNHSASTSIATSGSHRHEGIKWFDSLTSLDTGSQSGYKINFAYNVGNTTGLRTNYGGDHNHGASTSIGSAGSGNAQNIQPSISTYMWVRTA
ncbi:DUF859 family phage minor structural protein [Amedibacillus sp. YH-ame6]